MSLDYLYARAESGNGLEAYEARELFDKLNPIELPYAREIATTLREDFRGDIASLYTCFYISNQCANACSYCSYATTNDNLDRRTLSLEQIEKEAKAIKELGVKNVILISGTLPEKSYRDIIVESSKKLFSLGLKPWIEFENLSIGTLNDLSEIGVNHFLLFQETYNSDIYREVHRQSSYKRNFSARLAKGAKAFERGFQNIGIGVLLGLNEDIGFEIDALCRHAKFLNEIGANVSISLPSIKGSPDKRFRRPKMQDIEKAYITLKLALPNVSLALSGREAPSLRDRLFPIVDLIGTGGVTSPGGRTLNLDSKKSQQFPLTDKRSPRVIKSVLEDLEIEVLDDSVW
ncbi:MAG: radical SAM protein [Nanoarchaeota archaeon]|nr:radical SAM protein [Nanoarchaeota archaeon]